MASSEENWKIYNAEFRALKPDFCQFARCKVLRNTQRECRENNRKLTEIMPVVWEVNEKCMMCQDADFREMVSALTDLGKGTSAARLLREERKKKKK